MTAPRPNMPAASTIISTSCSAGTSRKRQRAPKAAKADRKADARSREEARALKKQAAEAEAVSARLAAQCSAIDRAMFDPTGACPTLAALPMSELAQRRAAIAADLEAAEARWLEVSEQLEKAAA